MSKSVIRGISLLVLCGVGFCAWQYTETGLEQYKNIYLFAVWVLAFNSFFVALLGWYAESKGKLNDVKQIGIGAFIFCVRDILFLFYSVWHGWFVTAVVSLIALLVRFLSVAYIRKIRAQKSSGEVRDAV